MGYAALAERAAWLPMPGYVRLDAVGPDASSWLQGLTTQDMRFAPGKGGPSLACDLKGKILAAFAVACVRPNHLVILGDRADGGEGVSLFQHMDHYLLAEKLDFSEQTTLGHWGIGGPKAREALARLFPELSDFASAAQRGDSQAIPQDGGFVVATGRLCASQADREAFFEILASTETEGGADAKLKASGLEQASAEAFELLRFERGQLDSRLLAGALPHEARRVTSSVSFTKGCYLGQETVARTHYRGGVKKKLAALVSETSANALPTPSPLHSGEEDAGLAFAARPSIALNGKTLIWAYLRLPYLVAGQRLRWGDAIAEILPWRLDEV